MFKGVLITECSGQPAYKLINYLFSSQGLEQHQHLQQLQWDLDRSDKDKPAGEQSSAHK